MYPKFIGIIKENRLIIDDLGNFKEYLKSLEQRKVEIIVKEYKTQRSSNQNRYYHGVVVKLISDHTGHTSDEVHELLKSMFLKKHLDVDTKEGQQRFTIVRSTVSLNTKEMEEYLAYIRMWASMDLSLSIPEPNEVEL